MLLDDVYIYNHNSSILVVINIKYGAINIIWKNNNMANFYLNEIYYYL